MAVYVGYGNALDEVEEGDVAGRLWGLLLLPPVTAGGVWRTRRLPFHTPWRGSLEECLTHTVEWLSELDVDSDEVWWVTVVEAGGDARYVVVSREHDRGVARRLITPYGQWCV